MVSLQEFLKVRLTKLKKEGSFTQGFSWTFSGTSLAFLIQLIFSPIISRIFGPEAYGEFAIYNLVTSNLISISTLAYPQALIINNRPKQYFSLSLLIIGLSVTSVVLFCVVYLIFSEYWDSLFPLNIEIVIIIGFATILSVLNDIFSKWNLIANKMKRNTVVNISFSSISKLYTIGFGKYISPSGWGLITAELLKVCLISSVILKKSTYKSIFRKLCVLNKTQIFRSFIKAKELKNYPFFIWPGNWLNMLSNQLPIIFFTMNFSMEELGAYTFAGSMVAIPNRLVGNAIRPVFF
jgi:O-antigen/teichoic acid export membrane protein